MPVPETDHPLSYHRQVTRVTTSRFNVRVPKTAELVAGHIRRQIVLGQLKEDDALAPESVLMEEFAISRPTLREAFRILESEGLITVRRGARGGARVQEPSEDAAARYAGLVLQHRGAILDEVLDARLIV
jgi:DNA-binding FadR family transcriptional regulator